MNRRHALDLFGGPSQLAEAIGCSRAQVYLLPLDEEIPMPWADRIRGAAARLGLLDRLREIEEAGQAASLHEQERREPAA